MRQLKISQSITYRDSQSIEKYLQEISQIDMISAEEEAVLARKIKRGDQEALQKLVSATCGLSFPLPSNIPTTTYRSTTLSMTATSG